jgi:hypothetical protein
MASTYTTSLGLELQATGENRASWGSKTNTNLSLIEEALSAMKTIPMTDADMTLTKVNAGTDQSRPMFLRFTGTTTAVRKVSIPTVSKFFFMENATTGGFSLTISTGAGPTQNYELIHNQWKLVFTDGSNIWSSDSLFSTSSEQHRWGIVPQVSSTGITDTGKAFDFHNANVDATDYAVRLETGGTTTDLYITPSGSTGKKIWNAGNMGPGSGLNADLLDNKHASEIFTEPPDDGKLYVRRTSGGVSSWVAIDAPWKVETNSDVTLNWGSGIKIRIRSDGFIRTASDVQIYSTTVATG